MEIYTALTRYKLGTECNVANVKQTAKRCRITYPLRFTRRELWTMYYVCKKKCVELLSDLP